MDKKIAGLLGAAAALTTITGAQAAAPAQTNDPSAPTTYQDLLSPVANPLAALKVDDARRSEQNARGTEVAQVIFHHHHRHHHHHWWWRYHHHHHHHHHHWWR